MSNIKTPEEIDRLLRERRIDKKKAEEYKDEWLERGHKNRKISETHYLRVQNCSEEYCWMLASRMSMLKIL